MYKFLAFFLIVVLNVSAKTIAQNRAAVVPIDDSLITIAIPNEPEPVPSPDAIYLDEALGKPVIWDRGWDTDIGHRTKIDRTVPITFTGIAPRGNYTGVFYTPAPDILHWGLQQNFTTSVLIYAKAVLLIDDGDVLRGGPFEWSRNEQTSIGLKNIYITDFEKYPQAWLRNWDAPNSGDRVWFFLMSDDERFSSNPVTFIWP